MSDRLSCFEPLEEYFLGVVHAIVPPRHLREMPAAQGDSRGPSPFAARWEVLYFGHGGSGGPPERTRELLRLCGEPRLAAQSRRKCTCMLGVGLKSGRVHHI